MISTLILILDLSGTFVFALSGAAAGVKHRLDLFGVLVLSFAAANSGGIVRDIFIGELPPPAISDWRYIAVPMLAGLLTFYWYAIVKRCRNPVLIFDAAGLALFAVSGTIKALAFHLGPLPSALMGVLTGVGGGIARDLLVAEIPIVLRAELYAIAALAGSTVVVIGRLLHVPSPVATAAGALLCFWLRFLAIRRGWRLPVADTQEARTATRTANR
jgi:uncharacterized membrane protein YeiH